MAERRMFAKTIIDSDDFLSLPKNARLLYYDLSMRADDEGFVNSPEKIMKTIGVSRKYMDSLIDKKLIIPFESGVVVVRHWFIHNYIRKDTFQPTFYQNERKNLKFLQNKIYDLAQESHLNGVSVDAVKDSIGKYSINNIYTSESEKKIRHKYGEYNNVLLSDDDYEKLKTEFPIDWSDRIENLSAYMASSGKTYKNHLATIRNWAKKDKQATKQKVEATFDASEFDDLKNYTVPDLSKKRPRAKDLK